MATILGTGTLADITENSPIIELPSEFGGAFGILLTGIFPGTVTLRAGTGTLAHVYNVINITNAVTRSSYAMTSVGMYFFTGFFDSMLLRLSGGSDGVTDIDFTVFIRGRP